MRSLRGGMARRGRAPHIAANTTAAIVAKTGAGGGGKHMLHNIALYCTLILYTIRTLILSSP